MNKVPRGQIQDIGRATQVRDYSGLRWAKVTPTDIDCFFEMDKTLFVIIEIKFGKAEIPDGQRWSLERLVNAISATKTAVLIHASHHIPIGQPIHVATCQAVAYYFDGVWYKHFPRCTVKELCDLIIKRILPIRWQRDFATINT